MPRRSPLPRKLSLFSVVIALAIVGCRQLAEKPAPQTSRKPSTPRQNSRPDLPPRSGGKSSNEGNLLLGNASRAARNADNFLLERSTYSLSYNRAKGGPNWVAWHTDASNLGRVDRRDDFRPDPALPPDSQIRPTDYRGSGYDRGHVCPSGDRTATEEENSATFYMSNMLPQTGALNRHVWADLENYLREEVRAGNEIYEIAGGMGSAGLVKGKINVPQVCWKVALILPEGKGDLRRIDARTRVIAVGMPNVEDKRLETGDWRSYLTSVDKIEGANGYDFLAELPDAVEKSLEKQVDAGR